MTLATKEPNDDAGPPHQSRPATPKDAEQDTTTDTGQVCSRGGMDSPRKSFSPGGVRSLHHHNEH